MFAHSNFSSRIRKIWQSGFLSNQSGNVALTFAIASFAIFGAAGAAYDYSNSQRHQTQVQNALDRAVLAAVLETTDPSDQIDVAVEFYNANMSNQYPLNATVSFSHKANGNLVGEVTGNVQTTLLNVVGVEDINISATAEAGRGSDIRAPICFMAMHPTRKHTLELKGQVSVYAPQCHIYGNSNHPYDVVDPHTSSNYVTAASIQAIGYGHHYIENLTPPLEYAPELIADPYGSLTLPQPGSCDFTDKAINGGSATLNPGTYCGGLKIKSGANVTLNSGLYIIEGDDFKVENSTLAGTGVTIMIDDGVKLKWKNSVVRLAGQTSGTYTSFVLMGARSNLKHEFKDSTVDLHGIVYIPNGEFKWENAGTPTITADWTVWIIDGVSWKGDGTININYNISDSSVPFPGGLNVIPRPGGNDTVRLFQ